MIQSHRSIDDASMVVLLRHARTAYAGSMRRALAPSGYDDIPKNGLYVIGGLALQPEPHPLGRLIEELGISKQAAGQLVDTLVTRGYLDRDVDASDRRRLKIGLTERGRAVAAIVSAAAAQVDREVLARCGSEALTGARQVLSALVDLARARGKDR